MHSGLYDYIGRYDVSGEKKNYRSKILCNDEEYQGIFSDILEIDKEKAFSDKAKINE